MTRTPPQPAAITYDVHPAVFTMQNWIQTLKDKTGRSLDEWIALVRSSGPQEAPARRDWLKSEFGLGANAVLWIAQRADPDSAGQTEDDPESYLRLAGQYVEVMFAGPKASLRPLYEAALRLARSLGNDVRVCPCRSMVPIYRHHVFAELKASTRDRVDLGLALGKYRDPMPNRLLDTGGQNKGDRITHRFAITRLAELDDEVKRWLKVAYDLDQAEKDKSK